MNTKVSNELLTISISHVEISTLVDLPCGDSPFKLQCAGIASVILGESELFAFITDFTAAGEGTVAVG